jgi:DNA repair exonuclease SbcCD ATPase subunit
VQQQRDAGAALRQAVDSGEAARRQLIDAQAVERTRWAEERTLLQERARDNEEQAATLARKIRSVVEAQRDQAGQHSLEKSRLEAEANEATQQLTELRAVHASLLATISQRLEAFERERAEWQAERQRATTEIDAAESWSSDQQDLLYRIRQQMATVFSLLDGSPHLLGPRPVTRELPAGTPSRGRR